MENLSHSLPKNAYNGNGFGAKTVYTDVFGGPAKFGVSTLCPGVGDYREIFRSFHTSRASSIPILDLPAFDDSDVSFDVRSSSFDYSEVFGGSDGLEFFVSHDKVLSQSKSGYDSSEEAWTPAQSETLSNESDPSACSERNQSLLNGDSDQAFVGTEPFNVSHNKANQRSNEDMSNGTSHVTDPHAIPGFSFLANETLQKMEDESPPLQVTDDLDIDMDFSGRIKKGKQFRKTMSQPPSRNLGVQTFGSDLQPLAGYGKAGSPPSGTFITISDISLRTQPSQLPPPSRPPPALAVKEANCYIQNPKLKASRSYAFERSAGNCSPPFFDVEIDASSSATASTAAMKDAMEKAQTKLRSAKEVTERKKEGLQSHMKLGLENDIKDKGKESKIFDEFNSSKDEKMQGKFDRGCCDMKILAREEKQKVAKTTYIVSDSRVGEEKHGKEFTSSQASLKTEISASWREATQFYEVVETENSKTVFEQATDENVFMQNTPSHEPGQKKQVSIEAFKLQNDDNRKNKSARKARERVVNMNNFEVVEQPCECDENEGILKATKESRMQEHHEKKEVARKVCEWEGNVEKLTTYQRQDVGMISTETNTCEKHENLVEVQHKENEVQVMQKLMEANGSTEIEKRQLRNACERKENGRRLKESLERGKYEKKHNEVIEKAKNQKGLKEVLEQQEKEKQKVQEKDKTVKRQNEALEQEEKCTRLQEALEQEKNEKRLKAFEQQDTEKRLKKIALELEESKEKQKLARERNENERRLREALKRKENEKKLNKGLEQEKNVRKQEETHKNEEIENRLIEAHEREEKKQLKEALEREGQKKCLQEADERDKALKEVFRQEEIGKRLEEATEWEETECSIKGAGQSEKLKERSKNHEPSERDKNGRKLKLNQETCEHLEGENFKATDGACGPDGNESLKAAQVPSKHDKHSENCKLTEEIILCTEDRKVPAEPKNSEGELESHEVEDVPVKESSDICGMSQNDLQHEKIQLRVEDAGTKSSEAGIGTGQAEIEGKKTTSQTASYRKSPNLLTHEQGEIGAIFDQEDNKEKLMSSQMVSDRVENGRKMGTSQPTVTEVKINAQKVSICQNTERKEKILDKILTTEEREKDERMKRERELEMDRLRKIEEEREREREREKDHMDIEKAIREVHERSLTEARERAERDAVERATAEARQRALAEARERLEKACAEVRERSFFEKASMEARLRAERAAAERANAEARERVERSVADKFYVSCRDGGMRYNISSSDLQFQNVALSSGSRYSHSSVRGGVEGESAQRCKARFERHQRTAERAAKALAEKNMRDILAQREQAERNRLAEVLDAEVKRWSNGKEGNLRALLSTLQYILGPDSGWQPAPLTEVITTVAVKKAYRKATLCVHPDKLQQRGASIQQKYICEKVFDLLKEAWNRFNSEER